MTLQTFIFQVLGWVVGLPLEYLVISAMWRGPYRQFPLVFAYTLVTFVVSPVEVVLFTQSYVTHNRELWSFAARIWWLNEGLLDLLILATVIQLIDQALATSPRRRVATVGLSLSALLFAGITFYIYYQPPPAKVGYWMTPWTQDISIAATVLDLALWFALLASRKRDRRVLLISGALGLQFTGEVIGQTVRTLSIPKMVQVVSLTGSVIVMLADLTCLYIWWQTFRADRNPLPERRA